MLLTTFFDTETTGLPEKGKSSVDPCQPKLVQLGAKQVDLLTREEYGSIDVIVYPDGWQIPIEASNVHRITQDIAERCGIYLEHAVLPWRDMVAVSNAVIAHNLWFDKLIMERASAMVDLKLNQDVVAPWTEAQALHCTMMKLTPIVKKMAKRPMHPKDYKWPKLIEAYRFFFNRDFSGAHNAMVDVDAMIEVFFRSIDLGLYAEDPVFGAVPRRVVKVEEVVEQVMDEPVEKASFADALTALVAAAQADGMRPADIVKAFAGHVQAFRSGGKL